LLTTIEFFRVHEGGAAAKHSRDANSTDSVRRLQTAVSASTVSARKKTLGATLALADPDPADRDFERY